MGEPITSEARYTCEVCGGPAIVHIRPDAGSDTKIRHLCLKCADAETQSPPPRDRSLDHAAVLLVVGAVVLAISVAADELEFGRSGGFGWRQQAGIGLGGLLLVIGAMIQVPTLMVIGLLTGAVTILADWVALGGAEGFGLKQIAGTLLGLGMILAGLIAGHGRRTPRPDSASARFKPN